MRRLAVQIVIATAALPAAAQTIRVDLPAGPLNVAVERLSRRSGISVVLTDPALWLRRIPAVRGSMTAETALRLVARSAGLEARRIGRQTWRLVPMRRAAARPPTPAAVPPPVDRDDIVVLASKRGLSPQWIAGSVERLTDLSAGVDMGTGAIVARSTVISSTHRGPGREKLFVRGIADSSFAGQLQSVTGLYLGEARLSYSATDPGLLLHDVAEVEVLEGPQGTLYGSGSLAGIIRIDPVMPRRGETAGHASTGLSAVAHGGPGHDGEVVANVSLAPDVAARLLAYARDEGGYIDKPAIRRDVNRTRFGGGRLIVRWWPDADWTVDATAFGQAIRGRDSQYVSAGAAPLTNLNARPEPFSSSYAAANVTVRGQVGGARLTSTTGVASQSLDERFDALDGRNVGAIVDLARRNRLLSHETRIADTASDGDTGWVVGVSHTDSTGTLRRRLSPGFAGTAEANRTRVSERALFGEGSVRLLPWLSLGAGARVARVRSSARVVETALPRDSDRPAPRTERWLLPTASASFRPARDWSAFLRYQEGRRPGAVVAGQGAFAERVPGDRLRSLEAGLRWDGAGPATATLSLSRIRWRDVQADYFEEGLLLFNTGLGDATIRSANATVAWTPSPAVRLEAAVTLNDGRLDRRSPPALDAGAPAGSVAEQDGDRRVPDVARAIARAGARWEHRLAGGALVRLDGWARYDGVSAAVIGPFAVGRQGDYLTAGATVAVRRAGGAVTVAVDNLTDTRATRFLLGSALLAGPARPTPVRPLTVRLGLQRAF